MEKQRSGSQSAVSGPIASASFGSLIEMQILRATESEPQGQAVCVLAALQVILMHAEV